MLLVPIYYFFHFLCKGSSRRESQVAVNFPAAVQMIMMAAADNITR